MSWRPLRPWIWAGLLVGSAVLLSAYQVPNEGWGVFFTVVPIAILASLGALIASRQAGNAIAWLLMAVAAAFLASAGLSFFLPTQPPDSLTVPIYLGSVVFTTLGAQALMFPIFLILFLFPTGEFASERWKWPIWIALLLAPLTLLVAAFAENVGPPFQDTGEPWYLPNPIGFVPNTVLELIGFVWVPILLAMAIGGVAALVVRYRRSGEQVRAQIRWVTYTGMVSLVSWLLILTVISDDQSGTFAWVLLLAIVAPAFGITVGITRYRLYEIDRIISRTVSYALIVTLLALVFAAGVVWLPTAVGLEDSPLLVAGTTLLVAALFNPLRRRVQEAVDRRFNRSRYQARLVEERFAAELQNAHSSQELADVWLETVDEALSPQASGLWLRPNDLP